MEIYLKTCCKCREVNKERLLVKVLHVISGGETGGSRKHVVTLLSKFPKESASLVVFQEGALAKEARELGVHVHVLAQSSRYDLSILKRLIHFIREGQYDIIHTHGPRANLFVSLIEKKMKALWVTTIHSDPKLDFIKTGLKGRIFTKLNLFALKKTHYFFAVSEEFKQNLIALGIDRDKIQTIYNGIDFSERPRETNLTRADLGLSEHDFVISMVARLHPIKGHELVFEAMKRISREDIHLLLIGNGPIEEELRNSVEQKGLQNQVHFLGFRKDIDDLYQISDISILSSYSESFPLALLEAANQRIPIITTDVGGVKQLISTPSYGWVVPIGDIDSIKNSLVEALKKKEEGSLKKMGEGLFMHASSHFSLSQLYHSIRATYQQLLNQQVR